MSEEIEKPSYAYEAKKDKPPYREFCGLLCEWELKKIDGLRVQIKKAKKLYINILNEIKNCNTEEEVRAVTDQHPWFEESYGQIDKNLTDMDRTIKYMEAEASKESTDGSTNKTEEHKDV
jgi:hypothetical protein